MQKLLYAILMATRKLLHYFTDHKVTVVTSYPLGDIVHNRNAAGRISKWALELMGHNIRYTPRTGIKSQALTNFVAKWPTTLRDAEEVIRRCEGCQFYARQTHLST